MNELNMIFKCNACKNVVEMVSLGNGRLICCGDPMHELKEITDDQGSEKHIPMIEETESGVKVIVGSIPHPMEIEHSIHFIEIIDGKKVYRKNLKPGEDPTAEFPIKSKGIKIRAYCNIHGLWKTEL
jgi:superoxide reductase